MKNHSVIFQRIFDWQRFRRIGSILFAPKSGKELRSDIREKRNGVLKDAKEIYADSGTKAKKIIEEAKHQAKEMMKGS